MENLHVVTFWYFLKTNHIFLPIFIRQWHLTIFLQTIWHNIKMWTDVILAKRHITSHRLLTCEISSCWLRRVPLHSHRPGWWMCAPSGAHSPACPWPGSLLRLWTCPTSPPQTEHSGHEYGSRKSPLDTVRKGQNTMAQSRPPLRQTPTAVHDIKK